MTSSPTTRNRLLKQGTGDNVNTWGDQQSSGDFDMIDVALDGMLQLTVTGPVTLSTANYVADQARNRSIKILAASSVASTITLPAVEKWALIWNASTFDQVIASQGGGSSVTVRAGELVPILTDAVGVARLTLLTMGAQRLQNLADPTSAQDATTKTYVDVAISSAAFSMGDFGVPITPGDAGKFLTTNGSLPSWGAITPSSLGLGSVDNTAVLGRHAIWIPASAMSSRATNGASAGSAETATNKVMLRTCDFDASTIEYVQFAIRMPKSWNEGTVTFVPEWSHAATATNFKVSWGLQAVAISDDDTLDAAFGTAQFSNDTGGTTNDLYAGPESAAITIAGTPAAEDLVVFQVLRKADDATNDTLAIDARLHGVTLYIVNNAGTDA